MPFVLAQAESETRVVSAADQFQAPKVFEHGDAASAENFDSFF